VSRTATAPVDRVKLLLQVQDSATALTVRDGWNRMVSEGARPPLPLSAPRTEGTSHVTLPLYSLLLCGVHMKILRISCM
jgi:hypothetical protein